MTDLIAKQDDVDALEASLLVPDGTTVDDLGGGTFGVPNGALGASQMASSFLDTDTALAANSDTRVASQKAVKAYIDAGGGGGITALPYRTLFFGAGRATTAGASGTKYFAFPANANISSFGRDSFHNIIPVFPLAAADYAISGLTTYLRIITISMVTTAPAITITWGFYPVTGTTSLTLGTVVSGSTVAATSQSANTAQTNSGSAFAIPSDGMYAVGYTLSGTPSGDTTFQAVVQVKNAA